MTDTQSSPVTAEELLGDVKTFFDHGEFFRAYDLAAEALELFPGDVWLAHRGVLSLANAGATALALEKYYEFGLDQRTETDVRSLLGRLKKDQAFAETGEARTALFREGRALYEDAFRTATGVHAAAIGKAFKKNDQELGNSIYSGVPSHFFGLEQVIDIGPMSGRSNVLYWLEKRGMAADDEVVDRILTAAKQSERVLTEEEILALVDSVAGF